jgi:hypothetical protein
MLLLFREQIHFIKLILLHAPPPPLPIINPYKVEFIGHTYNFNNKILVYSIFSFSTLYLINNEFKYLNFKLSETHGDTGGVDLNVFFNNDYFAIENRPSANKRYVESLFESPYKLKED